MIHYVMFCQSSDQRLMDRRLPAGNRLSFLKGGQELIKKRNSFLLQNYPQTARNGAVMP